MKKTSILLSIFCLSIVALFVCVNKSNQPSGLGYHNSIPQPVAADTQKPDATLSEANNVESQIEQIKNGDFSNITELSDYDGELLKWMYDRRETLEWVECDLNENGLKGLLWGKKDGFPLETMQIDVIFAVKDNEVRLVDATFYRQQTERFLLSKNGNIIYVYSFYGDDSFDHYTHYTYHDDWSKEPANSLTIIKTYDGAIERMKEDEFHDEWMEKYPHSKEAGIHYFRGYHAGEDEAEELEEQHFLEAFKEMTGYSFYDDNPMKPVWVDQVS